MFFFIAGIQPKSVYLDNQPRTCPSCGAVEARLCRVDHYVSVFFIPLFRVKKGSPALKCGVCGSISGEQGMTGPYSKMNYKTCTACGRVLDPGYSFCPHCGKRL